MAPVNVLFIPFFSIAGVPDDPDWFQAATVDGVQVEGLSTPSGFDEHRANALVCTDVASLKAFIADISRWREWVPDVDELRLLDTSAGSVTFYMKTGVPWPFRARDMIYRLTEAESGDAGDLRIEVIGLTGYLPQTKRAYRMEEVAGEWRVIREGPHIRVAYQLYVNPGPAPRFLANRRLARSLGKTLANLASHFPCEPA